VALNASGPISLAGATSGQSIASELGLGTTTQISMNDAVVRTLASVASGAITMPTNFWGKSNAYVFNATISADTLNYNLRSAAIAAGWNQTTVLQATVTINSGIYVGSSTTGGVAFTWTGSYPSGSTLSIVNNGTIEGAGGNGGAGYSSGGYGPGSPGSAGGPALQGNYAISITNNNVVGGGGGGGGAGNTYSQSKTIRGGGGGGGGGAGFALSSGGAAGADGDRSGGVGSAGTKTAGGAGAGGYSGYGGTGGNGGGRGAAGSAGYQTGTSGTGAAGGAGGNCTVSGTNAYITWTATGTRYGTLG
jgi:hypothetical protein